MKKLISIMKFYESLFTSKILFHILLGFFSILPILLAILVTIDSCHGRKYVELPVWAAWLIGICSTFGLIGLWSISWDL